MHGYDTLLPKPMLTNGLGPSQYKYVVLQV